MRILALILFASGCVYGPSGLVRPLNTAEQAARADAERAWKASEPEPLGERCDEDRPRLRVIIARDHAEMFLLTGYCGPSTPETRGTGWEGETRCQWGRAGAAYVRYRTGGLWPFALFETPWPAFVIWHERETGPLVRHESLHWIGQCATGDSDRNHTREVF